MNARVCVGANTHELPHAAGHLWVYLTWALALRDLGHDVVWLELIDDRGGVDELRAKIDGLRARLAPFGLADALAVSGLRGRPLPDEAGAPAGVDAAVECDLLLDVGNKVHPDVVARFRRSALVDIDPGIHQLWIAAGRVPRPRHHVCFTIGETVGTAAARFPDCGIRWHHTVPPVHLPEWPAVPARGGAPYTTVSSWWGWWEETDGQSWDNQKRAAFLEYEDLPSRAPVRFELALAQWGHGGDADFARLRAAGWGVRSAFDEVGTPAQYREYIRSSRAEFACAKASCMRLANAWISDRTLSYLASGRPAVVQHTGASRFLPDGAGLLRFRDPDEAVRAIASVEADYARHSREARALVEAHFDGRAVVRSVLERALP